MRKFMIACGLVLLGAACTMAQEGRGYEVSGDYQYVRFNPGGGASGINCQGGSGALGAYLSARWGVIGEFGACKVTGMPSGSSAHQMNYLFGPRIYFSTRGRFSPFVQTLFGGERLTASATGAPSQSTNAFAWTAGGGADIRLTRNVSLRAIQVEYLYTHFGGASQNSMRLQSGIVWRFGR
jgi:opacity protein-like surface antigen